MTNDNTNEVYNLQRFIDAQDNCFNKVVDELSVGRKCSHWMWFVFPQIKGLGRTSTAKFYAIANLAEARAYLGHDILGRRLLECTQLVMKHNGLTTHAIFGYPDELKFCSSMTLFNFIEKDSTLFNDALAKYCGGERDGKTLAIIRSQQ